MRHRPSGLLFQESLILSNLNCLRRTCKRVSNTEPVALRNGGLGNLVGAEDPALRPRYCLFRSDGLERSSQTVLGPVERVLDAGLTKVAQHAVCVTPSYISYAAEKPD